MFSVNDSGFTGAGGGGGGGSVCAVGGVGAGGGAGIELAFGGAGAGGGTPGGGQAWEFDLLATPFTVDGGFVDIPRGPGLGIEVLEERIAEHGDSWDPHPPPLWQLPDGSHCEW